MSRDVTNEQVMRELRDLKKIIVSQQVQEDEWLTPEKVKAQYGYAPRTIRKFMESGKVGVKRGLSGKMTLYSKADIEALFITIPKSKA